MNTTNDEASLDYRFSIRSPEDAHHTRILNLLMESSPNPMGFQYVHGGVHSSGRFRARVSGDIGLAEYRFEASAGGDAIFIGKRTRSHIARNRTAEYHLSIWLDGEIQMNWGNRAHTGGAGDLLVMDTQTPFDSAVRNRGCGINLSLPASWERIGDTKLENVIGHPFQRRDRYSRELASYARRLISGPEGLSSPESSKKLYEAISLALNPRAKNEHASGLLALIRNYIDTHCVNPDLGPAEVAAAFDISARHLHRLFSGGDASFTDYLIEQRLARARRLLADPNQKHRTILDIALECGFRDVNHFGRRFRARDGLTPGEFRAARN